VAYKPIVDKVHKKTDFEIVEGDMGDFDPGERTVSRADARCLVCQQVTKAKLTRQLAREGKMGQRLVAVVCHKPGVIGKTYRLATEKDVEIFSQAEKSLQQKVENWQWLDNPIPNEKMAPIGTYGIDAQRYTVNQEWCELFNSRQKLALVTFMEKIKMAYEGIHEECHSIGLDGHRIDAEEAAKAVMGYLTLIHGRLADKNAKLVIYNVYGEKIEHVFGRQALPMTWDYIELNVFSGANGDWIANKNWVIYSLENNSWNVDSLSFVSNSSATSLPFSDNYFDAVLTDPPYYDNVPYADLSDFFYVWFKRIVGDLFPDVFSTPLTPKSEEAIAEPMRHKNPEEFFETMLSESFKEIHRILKPEGIATIIYAHKTTAGWETLLNSLVNAGLVVTSSWPLHTEMKTRLRASASAALASSIYMVCRKIEREKVGFYSELQPQIKERVETKLQQFWNEGIAGGDFFISAIGPGMEIFSQYERVEKLSGEPVTTAELLDFIRSVSTDFIVRKLLSDAASSKIDNESEFYLAYRWTHLDNTVEYDDARKLASASGVTLEKLWGPGGFVKKTGSKISVLGPKERSDVDTIQSMVDVMHKTLFLWEKGKKEELSELLTQTGNADNPAFKQFCQAVAETLLNGNKEKQLLEGFLIGIDSYAHGKVMADKAQTDLKQFGSR
jgi:putative DNA methylase